MHIHCDIGGPPKRAFLAKPNWTRPYSRSQSGEVHAGDAAASGIDRFVGPGRGLGSTGVAADAARPVTITVDASRSEGPLPPVWRFFGADEPNYATMKDGRKLLVELGKLRHGEVYFRAHNLLNTGDGTPAFKWGSTNAYTETPRRQAGLRLDGRRSHHRHLSRRAASARTCRSASCPRLCRRRRPACPISICGGRASTTS